MTVSAGTAASVPTIAEPAVVGGMSTRGSFALRVVALVAMFALYFFAYFQRTGVPGTIFDELQRDFSLTAWTVTSLGAVFLYVYAGMQLVVGLAADRYGGRKALLFGSLMMCLGALLFPLAGGTVTLFASRILIGFGSSFVFLSIVKEVDTLFAARHFAWLMGLTLAVSYLGNTASTLPLERAVHYFGWRPAMMVVGACSTIALAVAWIVLRRLPQPPPHVGLPLLTMLTQVFRNRRCRPLFVYALSTFPILFVTQSMVGKKLLQNVGGMSSATAAGFVLLMAAISGAAALGGGLILRWIGQRRKPIIVLASSLVLGALLAMIAAILFRPLNWLLPVGYVMMACTIVGSAAFTAMSRELNNPGTVAVAVSVFNGTTYVGAGIVGNLAGLILNLFGGQERQTPDGSVINYPPEAYAAMLGFCALMALATLLVMIFRLPETCGRSLEA